MGDEPPNAYMESINNQARLGVELTNHEIRVIDDITECLLPNVSASLWFDILTFYNSGYGLNEGEDKPRPNTKSRKLWAFVWANQWGKYGILD